MTVIPVISVCKHVTTIIHSLTATHDCTVANGFFSVRGQIMSVQYSFVLLISKLCNKSHFISDYSLAFS